MYFKPVVEYDHNNRDYLSSILLQKMVSIVSFYLRQILKKKRESVHFNVFVSTTMKWSPIHELTPFNLTLRVHLTRIRITHKCKYTPFKYLSYMFEHSAQSTHI